jgi:hypothetical protein
MLAMRVEEWAWKTREPFFDFCIEFIDPACVVFYPWKVLEIFDESIDGAVDLILRFSWPKTRFTKMLNPKRCFESVDLTVQDVQRSRNYRTTAGKYALFALSVYVR